MSDSTEEDVYGSGLRSGDWLALRDVIWPFIHSQEPSKVEIPFVPAHLQDHPLMEMVRQYRETGRSEFLDKAGQYLIPTDEAFGWYVPLTK